MYRAHLFVCYWGCCLLLVMTGELSAAVSLPRPTDVPTGPEKVVGPGGAALPPLCAEVAADAPAISAAGEVCLPDETLVLTGDHLSGAGLRVWLEGRVEDLPPLRTAQNRMQAIVPKTWLASTMLVWPMRDQRAGRPIRINGATVWWAWPSRATQENAVKPISVSLMGKNLKLGSTEPRVYVQGPGVAQWLSVVAAGAYQLTVQLPGGLRPGSYQLFAHNGSGGAYGWSEPVRVEVIQAASQQGLGVYEADRFGAKPDDAQDDAAAIQQAIDAAAKAGGGTVRFSAGVYHLGTTLQLPNAAGGGIHLVGAGMGDYNPKTQTTTGRGTVLRYLPGGPVPKCLLLVGCRFSSCRDLSLIGGHEGIFRGIHDPKAPSHTVVRVVQHDVTFERVRVVMLDLRPAVPPEKREDLHIYDAAMQLYAPGEANLVVCDCQLHSPGAGIAVGGWQRGHGDAGLPEPSVNYVRIERCVFRGYSPGFYKEPPESAYQYMGCLQEGIQLLDGKYVVVEGCDFAGADRRGGKMMNRSILVYNTSIRNLYIANNRCHDVGMICPRSDRWVNQGEQIVFHFCYPHGGYFDVLEANPTQVTVHPADPRNAGQLDAPHAATGRVGSRVLEEVGANDHWLLFVSAGKGVGQYRVVVGTERKPDRVVLKLDRPWRVVPDQSSRVTLTVAFRQNIICGNSIDPGFIDPRCKVAGILFWFNAFDNIVAGNTLRNVSYAVGFNSSFRNPCCWNLVRDNVAENLGGMSVECAEPAFYFDSCGAAGGPTGPLFQPGSDVAGWYAIGNVYRSNQGRGSSTGAFVYAELNDAAARQLPQQTEAGVVMPVLEHNQFSAVKRGIVVNRGTVWPVIRDNVVDTASGKGPAVYDQNKSSGAASPVSSGKK